MRGIAGAGQGTTQRFVLLLVLFITGSVYMFSNAFEQLADPHGFAIACELAAGIDPNTDNPANILETSTSGFNDCIALHAGGWRYVWVPLAATGLVFLLAMAHYGLYPRWQRRRRRVVPLERSDPDRAVRDALAGLKSRIGLAATLDYVVDLSAGSPGARVFGRRPGKYTVCLNAGLIALFGRDTDAFDATMLHEFAHIRNRDIGITYLTVAIWRVFLICSLTPYALTQAFYLVSGLLARHPSPFLPGMLPLYAGSIALAASFVVLIYLAMADVLRSREHFADLDAVALGADRVYWLRHVAAVPAGRSHFRIARELRAALRPHPSWEKRNAILIRPRDVHTVRALSMFVTGMAAQLLAGFMGTATIGMSYSWIQDNAVWPAAGLTTAVAGFAVWRNTTREISAGRPAPSGFRAGFWLGVGQLAGGLLIIQEVGNAWSPPSPWALVLVLVIIVPTAILWWTAGCASLWTRRGGLRGLVAGAATIAVTTAAFAWWFNWWQSIGMVYVTGNQDPTSASFADHLSGFPHTTTTEIIATAIGPLGDLLVAHWGIWLTAALWILPLISVRSRDARVTGIWSGCAAAAAVIFITFRAHGWNGHGSLTISQNYFIYIAWIHGILLCAAVAAAFLASLRGNGHAAPAMAAAGITTAIGAVAVVATFGTDGCLGPLDVQYNHCFIADSINSDWGASSDLFGLLLPMLGMLTLVAAASAAAIVRMTSNGELGQCAPTDPPSAAPARLIWRPLAWTRWWCAACFVLAGLSIPAYLYDASLGSTSTASLEGQGQTEPAAPGAVSVQLQAEQLVTWWGLGGGNFIDQLGEDASKLAALDPNGSPHESKSESMCSTIMSLAATAQAYLPPPDPLIAQSWSAAIGEASAGARQCLAGLSRHDNPLAKSGILEIYDADHTVNDITSQIGSASRYIPSR